MGSQGRLTSLGIGKESTWGTPVSATTTFPLASFSVWETSTFEDGDDLHQGGGGVTRRRAELARDVGGTLEALLTYEALGLLVEGALGTNSSSGAGPYTHALTETDLDALPSYTLRGRWGSSSHLALLSGCKVNSLKLSWKARGWAKLSADILGYKLESFTSGSPGTPTIGDAVLPHQVGNFAWNSVNYTVMTSVELEVKNNLVRTPVLGSLYTGEPEPGGRREVTVKCSARLTAAQFATLVGNRQAGDQAPFTFTFTGLSSRAWAVTVHNAQIIEGPTAHPTQAGPLEVSFTLAATDDGTGFDGVAISITNANSSYAS